MSAIRLGTRISQEAFQIVFGKLFQTLHARPGDPPRQPPAAGPKLFRTSPFSRSRANTKYFLCRLVHLPGPHAEPTTPRATFQSEGALHTLTLLRGFHPGQHALQLRWSSTSRWLSKPLRMAGIAARNVSRSPHVA